MGLLHVKLLLAFFIKLLLASNKEKAESEGIVRKTEDWNPD